MSSKNVLHNSLKYWTKVNRKNKTRFRREAFLRTLIWEKNYSTLISKLESKIVSVWCYWTVTGKYLTSGLGVANMSAECDDVRKLRLVTLEMGTWERELLGCSSNLTTKILQGDINH